MPKKTTNTIDRNHLQTLVDAAITAQEFYYDTLRDIEHCIGVDIDDLGEQLDVDLILDAVNNADIAEPE